MSVKCKVCTKNVYPMDQQINLDGNIYHNTCAKCADCQCQITIANFCTNDSGDAAVLLCTTHYTKRYQVQGGFVGTGKFQTKAKESTASSVSITKPVTAKCKICAKSVYPMDPQINLDGSLFHHTCAKCTDCKCQITVANFSKVETLDSFTLLCNTHFAKRISESGGYIGGEKFQNKSTRDLMPQTTSETVRSTVETKDHIYKLGSLRKVERNSSNMVNTEDQTSLQADGDAKDDGVADEAHEAIVTTIDTDTSLCTEEKESDFSQSNTQAPMSPLAAYKIPSLSPATASGYSFPTLASSTSSTVPAIPAIQPLSAPYHKQPDSDDEYDGDQAAGAGETEQAVSDSKTERESESEGGSEQVQAAGAGACAAERSTGAGLTVETCDSDLVSSAQDQGDVMSAAAAAAVCVSPETRLTVKERLRVRQEQLRTQRLISPMGGLSSPSAAAAVDLRVEIEAACFRQLLLHLRSAGESVDSAQLRETLAGWYMQQACARGSAMDEDEAKSVIEGNEGITLDFGSQSSSNDAN